MLGKALSLVVVAALVGAGAVQASSLSRAWIGSTSNGDDFHFSRRGKAIYDVTFIINWACPNRPHDSWQPSLPRATKIGPRGRIATSQRLTTGVARGPVTFTGTTGSTKAHGTIRWTLDGVGPMQGCHGHGSSRWTATADRPVADPNPIVYKR